MPATLPAVQLTLAGQAHAQRILRNSRLWESYLAKHFDLPLDHLHAPAERMEHYISPDLNEQLGHWLTDAKQDPHGREIPKQESD